MASLFSEATFQQACVESGGKSKCVALSDMVFGLETDSLLVQRACVRVRQLLFVSFFSVKWPPTCQRPSRSCRRTLASVHSFQSIARMILHDFRMTGLQANGWKRSPAFWTSSTTRQSPGQHVMHISMGEQFRGLSACWLMSQVAGHSHHGQVDCSPGVFFFHEV